MKYLAGSFAILVAAAAHASDVSPTAAVPPMDPRGAVLCQWGLAVTVKAIGETCFPGRDKDYIAGLDWAISEMDAFILRNSDTTQDWLRSSKAKVEQEARENILFDRFGRCVPDQAAFVFYPKAQQKFDRQRLESEIHAFLAVDRPPVMNPCL